jgi:hypothetical protein
LTLATCFFETIPAQLAFFGDSRVAHMSVTSANLPTIQSFPSRQNYGAGGTTSAQAITAIQSNPAANPYAPQNAAVIFTGVNDAANGLTISQTLSNLILCCTAATAAGYRKVFLCTEISDFGYGGGGSADAFKNTLNPEILSQLPPYTAGICRLDLGPLGQNGANTITLGSYPDNGIYENDQLHPTYGIGGDPTNSTLNIINPTIAAAVNAAVSSTLTLCCASIDATGSVLTLTFSAPVTGGAGGLSISTGGTIAYTSGSGTNQLVFDLGTAVIDSQTPTLTYASGSGNIASSGLTGLASFSGTYITNLAGT